MSNEIKFSSLTENYDGTGDSQIAGGLLTSTEDFNTLFESSRTKTQDTASTLLPEIVFVNAGNEPERNSAEGDTSAESDG